MICITLYISQKMGKIFFFFHLPEAQIFLYMFDQTPQKKIDLFEAGFTL